MTRLQRLLVARGLLVLCGLFPAGCASPGASGSERGDAMLVTLLDFKSGKRFELASESHTDRVAYYSEARTNAARKVLSDDIMSDFVDLLESEGLADHAQTGRAPGGAAGGGAISWGLELQSGEETGHWLVGKGSALADWQAFQRCRDMFLAVYNETVSFQTMRNDGGKGFFDEQARAATGGKQP